MAIISSNLRNLISIAILLFAQSAMSGYKYIEATCYDGTDVAVELGNNSCLTSYGINYLRSKATALCKTNCSPYSGKCGVNTFSVKSDNQCNSTITKMYRGFTVQCHDGSKLNFNTCSTPENFYQHAQRLCEGKTNPQTGKSGVNSYSLKGRCN